MNAVEQIRAAASQGLTAAEIAAGILRRDMTAEERNAYDAARGLWKLREAKRRADARAAKVSDTERKRMMRKGMREAPPFPECANPEERESCKFDLLRFGLRYAKDIYGTTEPLLKRPPSPRMVVFIEALQDKILHGGLKHVRWPRGKGKTTWVKVAVMWAMLYGHKRFAVVVEQTSAMAQVTVQEIWNRIYLSQTIAADFPEFAVPMKDVEMTTQRMRVQTHNGELTRMKQDLNRFGYFQLPTIAECPWTGGIMAFRGAEQALRGININSTRPDFFFIDDPQKDEAARNPATIAKIEKNINGAVLGAGEIDRTMSAVMASTPIEPGDVSEIFADNDRHPEWQTTTERFVAKFGDKTLMGEYLKRVAIDEAKAHEWYVAHRAEIENGVEMMDDGDFDPTREVSAYEHALNLLHTRKPTSFFCEYQMSPTRSQGVYKISPKVVRECVNGVPYGIVPKECDQGVLAFCDVNANAGLRWEICAFGKGRVAAVMAYGQYPREGERLYPEGIPESSIPAYLAPAIREVASAVMAVSIRTADGSQAKCRGICFDGGWQTDCVATAVAGLIAHGVPAAWSKGYDTKNYSRYHHEQAAQGKIKGVKAAEECHTWVTANGKYLAINADHWKEISQTSFFAKPLTPSSSSFWGDAEIEHYQFAEEVCNEVLKAKDAHTKYGFVYEWEKSQSKPNHFGDCHASVLAYGSICGCFDSVASVASTEELQEMAKAKKRRCRYVYKH